MKKTVIGCIVAAALAVVGIAALAALAVAFWFFSERPLLEARLEAPAEVGLDETFELSVILTNTHEKAVVLDSLDVSESFLAGFQLVDLEPPAEDTMRLPVLDQRSWSFSTSVEPGGALDVVFTLKAIREGHFTGTIDVCNPAQDYRGYYADVVVRGAEDGGE